MVQSSRMNRFEELTKETTTTSTSSLTSTPNLHELQARLLELESILQSNQNKAPSIPPINLSGFVAVLLDGDSDYFDSMYLKEGFRGGRSAANDLREKTQFYLSRQYGFELNSIEVLGYIFVNLVELRAYLFRKVGISTNTIDDFFRGFNTSQLMASIDCGSYDQAVNESLKNWLSHYSKQSDCKYLILGGAQDAAYAGTLYRLSPEQRKKITILRTSSKIAYHLRSFGFPEACFTGLFDDSQNTDDDLRELPSNGSTNRFMTTNHCKTFSTNQSILSNIIPTSSTASNSSRSGSTSRISSMLRSTVPTTTSSAFRAETAPFIPSNSTTATRMALYQAAKERSTSASTPSTSNIASTSTTNNSTRQIPTQFIPLIEQLKIYRQKRSKTVLRATMGSKFRDIYNDNKYPTINNFASYAALAEEAGLVELGGAQSGGREWIALKEESSSTYSSTILPGIQIEPKFLPLVNVLDELHRAGHVTVLRSTIGNKFISVYKAYPSIINFAAYVHQAELAELVVLGGKGSGGREWIALNRNPTEISISNRSAGEGNVRVVKNSAFGPRIIASSSTIKDPFSILVNAINSYLPQTNINRGLVSEKHHHSFLPIYNDPAFPDIVDFRSLSREAEKAKFVRLTRGSTIGEAWISVRTPSPEIVEVVETPIAQIPIKIQEQFQPLITALQSYSPETGIVQSEFAAKYSSSFRHIYNSYRYNMISDFYSYCTQAEIYGYVRLNVMAGGESLISLGPALMHTSNIRTGLIPSSHTSSQAPTPSNTITTTTETFLPLITALRKYSSGKKVNTSDIISVLHSKYSVYSRASVETWEDYLEKAVQAGVVVKGDDNDTQTTNGHSNWISLEAEYLVSS